jgi:predicted Zn-dependent peptidase
MAHMTKRERAALKERVENVLGGWGAHSRLARGLEVERSTLERIYTGDTADVPAYVVAILELLEALPAERWPERWQSAAQRS